MTLQSTSFKKFLSILRNALNITDELPAEVSAEEWTELYKFSQSHALLGVVFEGVRKMKDNAAPPFQMLMQWIATAEKIRGMNQKFNAKCKQLTEFFEKNGHKTAILKG